MALFIAFLTPMTQRKTLAIMIESARASPLTSHSAAGIVVAGSAPFCPRTSQQLKLVERTLRSAEAMARSAVAQLLAVSNALHSALVAVPKTGAADGNPSPSPLLELADCFWHIS